MKDKKIIGGRFIVERQNAYFFYEYLSVEAPNENKGAVMHIPEFASKAIFESIQTVSDCIKFLKGSIFWDVRTHPLNPPLYGEKKTKVVNLPNVVYVAINNFGKIDKYVDPSKNKAELLKYLKKHGGLGIQPIKPIKKFNIDEVITR